jgi:hypothetical protein
MKTEQGVRRDDGLLNSQIKRFGCSALFGREKDDNLRGSLSAVLQTFDGKAVYPSLEEKAAHLLYFLVKNHSFVDGNISQKKPSVRISLPVASARITARSVTCGFNRICTTTIFLLTELQK